MAGLVEALCDDLQMLAKAGAELIVVSSGAKDRFDSFLL